MISWEDAKKVFSKYDIDMNKSNGNGIHFKQIARTKKYFTRRPQYKVFDFSEETDNSGNMIEKEWVLSWSRDERGSILYYQPKSFEDLPSWDLEDFLTKKTNPTRLFNTWNGKRIVINDIKQLEWALKDFFERLEVFGKLNKNEDLEAIKKEYKEQQDKLAQINSNIDNLKKRFKNIFKTQAGINADF